MKPQRHDNGQFVLDLSEDRRCFTRYKGDITVIGTWLVQTGRPALVLVNSRRPIGHQTTIPCIVPIEHAWLWDEAMGDGRHCAVVTYGFANSLGMNAFDPKTLVMITSVIREHLGDLLTMPQQPNFDQRVVAEITKTDLDTGKVEEAEILTDV